MVELVFTSIVSLILGASVGHIIASVSAEQRIRELNTALLALRIDYFRVVAKGSRKADKTLDVTKDDM